MRNTLFVNLFGGPGLGKSTTAAGAFSLLKLHGVDAELVTEFPKDLVWEKRDVALGNQVYIFGEQHHRHWRLDGMVDVVVSDGPILLSAVYESDVAHRNSILRSFEKFNNMNFLLRRVKPYNPNGRLQTEAGAMRKDREVAAMLEEFNQDFETVDGDHFAMNKISEWILNRLGIETRYRIANK